MAFLPELILLAGALAVFVISLGEGRVRLAKATATGAAVATLVACVLSFRETAILFDGAYRVDLFSQGLKLVFALGFLLIVLVGGELPDIREDAKPEYYLFLTLSVTGLTLLVSCVDLLTLVVALQLASFPLYFLVALRRERGEQRSQIEAVVKYIMFGITATGIMLFGMSYLFGVTGTTSLPTLQARLAPLVHSPVVIAGLALMWAGLLYKLAVFPFHFWTPDVYQGGSNETTSLVASLPKLGAIAVLVRFVTLATPDHEPLALLLSCLAIASMCYGNVVALVQKDVKRLLGFSGIAHAGYALIGLVTLDPAGYAAALYYLIAYQFMVLACFVVVCRVAREGGNVALEDLAGLHRRSPLLMATLLVGVFGLAGLPPFAGFMAKLTLLKAALAKGHLTLVIIAVLNTAVAIYYYLALVREACFREPEGRHQIRLDASTRALCVVLIAGVVLLGLAPAGLLEHLSTALATAWGPIGLAATPLP
jgi:NADH-quinone oxidoreductase subunit N